MKFTLKHYYPFSAATGLQGGSLLSADAWDRVRLGETALGENPAFGLPSERNEWLRLCRQNSSAAESAAAIAEIIRREDYRTVISVGVGRACVEFHLKSLLPAVRLVCTEYAPRVVERLRAMFTECDRIEHWDLLAADWTQVEPQTLVLLNRVDTELDDSQWAMVFGRLYLGGIRDVLVIATGFVTFKMVLMELALRIRSVLRREPLTFAGYARTERQFREMWGPHYEIIQQPVIAGLQGYLLRRVN